jgi:hypothetical protein
MHFGFPDMYLVSLNRTSSRMSRISIRAQNAISLALIFIDFRIFTSELNLAIWARTHRTKQVLNHIYFPPKMYLNNIICETLKN